MEWFLGKSVPGRVRLHPKYPVSQRAASGARYLLLSPPWGERHALHRRAVAKPVLLLFLQDLGEELVDVLPGFLGFLLAVGLASGPHEAVASLEFLDFINLLARLFQRFLKRLHILWRNAPV